MMESEVEEAEGLLAILVDQVAWRIRSVYWLADKGKVLTGPCCCRPLWEVGMEIGKDEFDGLGIVFSIA
jgi:hypothetical protein